MLLEISKSRNCSWISKKGVFPQLLSVPTTASSSAQPRYVAKDLDRPSFTFPVIGRSAHEVGYNLTYRSTIAMRFFIQLKTITVRVCSFDVISPTFLGRSMQRSARFPDLPFLWGRYRVRFYLATHGASLSRLWQEIKVAVCYLPGAPGLYGRCGAV